MSDDPPTDADPDPSTGDVPDRTADETPDPATDQDPEPMTTDTTPTDPDRPLALLDDPEMARRYLQWAAVGLLALLALVATLRVYTGASAAIDEFVARRYRPLFQAAFNLAVLLLAVVGITSLLRRLQAAT